MGIKGHDQVVQAIRRYEDGFRRHVEDIPYEFKTSIVRQIVRVRAIDTAAMIQAENYHRDAVTNTGYRYRIDTSDNPDVFYDGFVEFPTRNVSGTIRYGRYFVRDGIRSADLERIFESVAREAFVN